MATSDLILFLQFLCERENSVCWRFVLLRTGLQQIYLQIQAVVSLREGKIWPAVLAQV